MEEIYLDNAATSYPKPSNVMKCVIDLMKRPLSANRSGFETKKDLSILIEQTRTRVKQLINAKNEDNLIFCLNATEALNIVLNDVLRDGDHVICSSFEHLAVKRTLNRLSKDRNISFTLVYPNDDGLIEGNELNKALNKKTKLVIMSQVSNVTGNVLYDAESIGQWCQNRGIYFCIDASQSIGHIQIDVQKIRPTMVVFSGHKGLFGYAGVGCMYVSSNYFLNIFREGGLGVKAEYDLIVPSQSKDYETGTQNIMGIVSLNEGVSFLKSYEHEKKQAYEMHLYNYLLAELRELDFIKIYGNNNYGSPLLSINLDGFTSDEVGELLKENYSIIVRAGLHCAPDAHKYLGTYPSGTIRISLSVFNTKKQIDYLKFALKEIYKTKKELEAYIC